ncbi:MAG: terminase, partial [Rhizobiales bacterium]|nr:terminase [Hyphomicrobiales bacterium]
KTTTCVMELLRRASEQPAAPDGMKYTRFSVVRQTLKQLRDTVLKDCQTWLSALGQWKPSENTFHLNFDRIRSEWIFIPLEDSEDQGRLLSMQLTGAFLSECIEMDISVLGPIAGRCGRYPSGAKGVCRWAGMIADTNRPVDMTPWQLFMETPPPEWQIFFQPSGLSKEAENLEWLAQTEETLKLALDDPVRLAQGRKYYERLVAMYGEDSDYVKRYVLAQYGNDPSGHAVFRDAFLPRFHTVDGTVLVPGYPIIVGQDFGRDPWSLVCQVDHMGRLVVHEEVPVPEHGMGLEKHVEINLRAVLAKEKYLGFKVAMVGDPSGQAKDSISEETNFDALRRMGFPAFPAPTNDIDPRLRAVESFLHRQVNGGPAIVINRVGCPTLVRALAGGYRFTKGVAGQRKPRPDKNEYSHVCDCLQYVCLVCNGGGLAGIARALRPRVRPSGPRVSAAAWT